MINAFIEQRKKGRIMTRLQETQRLTAEWVRMQSAQPRREPIRGYDFRHCASDMDRERARLEAIAAAAMAKQFLVQQVTV